MVYRALVRALVALLKARKHRHDDRLVLAAPYLNLIERIATPRLPYLLLCHGYSGSGKSVASEALVSLIGAVRLSSDVERKRSGPFVPVDPRPLPPEAYSAHSIDQHYEMLRKLTQQVLVSGYPTVVDATFLKRMHRGRFVALAQTLGVPVFLLDFHARMRQLEHRVQARAAASHAESDAGHPVLIRQLANEEPLSREEMERTVSFDTEVPMADFSRLNYWLKLLRRLCEPQQVTASEVSHG
jgi:predicted kinase